jgi:hypothetical protein
MSDKREAVLLRLEPALKQRLFEQAKRNDRSASAEASRIVRERLEQDASPRTVEERA